MKKQVSEPLAWVSYRDFLQVRLKACRNENLKRLTIVKKTLFKTSMELARLRDRIVNLSLLKILKPLFLSFSKAGRRALI